MTLDQTKVSKQKLEEMVRSIPKKPPHGGPSDGETLEEYKIRLFNWLVTAAGTDTAARSAEWQHILYKWCEKLRVGAATAVAPVTTRDLKLIS